MKHHLPFESRSQWAAGKVGSKLSSVGATFPVHHHKNVMNGCECDSGREETGEECDLKCSGNYTAAMDCQLYKVMTLFIRSSLWHTEWRGDLPSVAAAILFFPHGSRSLRGYCVLMLIIMYIWDPPRPPTNNGSCDRQRDRREVMWRGKKSCLSSECARSALP